MTQSLERSNLLVSDRFAGIDIEYLEVRRDMIERYEDYRDIQSIIARVLKINPQADGN